MASPARRILPHLESTPPPCQPPALPNELLEEILLRASPTTLARASVACSTFRRLVADRSFLRRYRSIHPPLLLGFHDGDFRPTEPPHPCAVAGRAFALAADFNFDGYVPRDGWFGWATSDVRDGRVLLRYGPWPKKDGSVSIFPDLAVCDPVFRRYRLLPPIPDALHASVQVHEKSVKCFDAFIVPSGDDEEDTMFRVMGAVQCLEKLAVFIYSSSTGSWNVAASTTWEALSLTVPQQGHVLGYGPSYFAYGCFYKKVFEKNKLLKFDVSTTEFSTVDLPPRHDNMKIVVVEAGQGRLGVFSQINAQMIRYSIRQNEGQKSREWKMVSIIPLPKDHLSCIVGALRGYIFLSGQERRNATAKACFSMEIKTLKIERVGWMMGFHVFPYFGYPPSMSPRSI
ncbi:hypothetical protein EJB05_11844, partial [Eragrostis curvula]